jgi:hypothetical protein
MIAIKKVCNRSFVVKKNILGNPSHPNEKKEEEMAHCDQTHSGEQQKSHTSHKTTCTGRSILTSSVDSIVAAMDFGFPKDAGIYPCPLLEISSCSAPRSPVSRGGG